MNSTTDLRHVRATLWTMLGFCTASSVAANVAHAVMNAADGDWLGPVLIALLAPIILLGLMHLLGVWSRDVQSRGAVFWAILATMVGLGATAFRLSFAAVRDLAMHYGLARFDAALVPLMLDGVIVTCTVSLVVVSRLGTPAVPEHATVEQPAASRETETADTVERVAAQATVPRGVPAPDTVAAQRDTKPAEQAVTCDVPRDTGDVPTEPIPVPHRVEVAEQPTASRDVQLVETVEQDDDYRRIAEHIVDAGRTQASSESVLVVLRGAAQGLTVRELAKAAGISTGAVSRITKAAKETTTELAEASA